MRSFVDLDRTFGGQPRELGPELARIDTGKGQERLFADQAPQLLRALSENARIASITASNAIENVTVAKDRAERIAEGSPRFRNRNEKEFAGYRDAIDSIMRLEQYEPLTVPLLLHLHRLLFKHSGGRGGHLKSDQNLIVSYETGRREIVFTPPDEHDTPMLLTELLDRYNEAKREGRTHPIVLIGALIVDLLAIHPVADGNGRLARLLTTYELLDVGYGVARYVSVEQRIFEAKNTYYQSLYESQRGWYTGEHTIWPWTTFLIQILDSAYEDLEQRIFEAKNTYYQSLYESQRGWHTGEHTIWPWTTFLIQVLDSAYEDLERRVAAAGTDAGSKQDRVREHILRHAPVEFRTRDIQRALPGISPATVRLVLNKLRDGGEIASTGKGSGARWHRKGR